MPCRVKDLTPAMDSETVLTCPWLVNKKSLQSH
jgi:hypothetical protein